VAGVPARRTTARRAADRDLRSRAARPERRNRDAGGRGAAGGAHRAGPGLRRRLHLATTRDRPRHRGSHRTDLHQLCTPPPRLREAIQVRDGTCRAPDGAPSRGAVRPRPRPALGPRRSHIRSQPLGQIPTPPRPQNPGPVVHDAVPGRDDRVDHRHRTAIHDVPRTSTTPPHPAARPTRSPRPAVPATHTAPANPGATRRRARDCRSNTAPGGQPPPRDPHRGGAGVPEVLVGNDPKTRRTATPRPPTRPALTPGRHRSRGCAFQTPPDTPDGPRKPASTEATRRRP
jgi:hypothetical protein